MHRMLKKNSEWEVANKQATSGISGITSEYLLTCCLLNNARQRRDIMDTKEIWNLS